MKANELNAIRAQKALDTKYNFNGRVMTMREFLGSKELTYKSTVISNTSEKRVHLEYKTIKPRTSYTIWYKEGESELGMPVPKLIWDLYELPTIHKDICRKVD